jgi:ubiquinone/menaquinone biosynthesis C-methylase UbiE
MKQQRRSKDIGIDGFAARLYDKNTRKTRLAEMRLYAHEVAKHVSENDSVLEVAPGPGYLAIELAKLGKNLQIAGLDISKDFVEIARQNAHDARVEVDFRHGNVANIPYSDNSFDFIICTAAFKNFKEPVAALNEMHRVLKPDGTTLIVDMNRTATNQQINQYVKNLRVKGLEKAFLKFTFKYILRNGAYTRNEFMSLTSQSLFKRYEIQEDGIGFYIYLRS